MLYMCVVRHKDIYIYNIVYNIVLPGWSHRTVAQPYHIGMLGILFRISPALQFESDLTGKTNVSPNAFSVWFSELPEMALIRHRIKWPTVGPDCKIGINTSRPNSRTRLKSTLFSGHVWRRAGHWWHELFRFLSCDLNKLQIGHITWTGPFCSIFNIVPLVQFESWAIYAEKVGSLTLTSRHAHLCILDEGRSGPVTTKRRFGTMDAERDQNVEWASYTGIRWGWKPY